MAPRRVLFTIVVTGLAAWAVAAVGGPRSARARTAQATPIYLDRSYSFAERAADLVSRMTLAEKASQAISSQAPAIPRLGVRAYGWWNEALHGVSRLQLNTTGNATTLYNTTSYPIDQSLGASWDPRLVYRVAGAISDEAREVAPDNTQDLDFYSPTINLERDPRWGRNDEAWSEDPLLVSRLVAQYVDGMEGKDRHGRLLAAGGYAKVLTTIKHYAANNSEVNRLTGSSDMDDRTLREYYTKTFRDIVRRSHPGSVMSAYNSVNGTPAAADPYLIDTLLRETFGFDGYVTSDCDAIYEIQHGHHWQPPGWTRPVNEIERHAFAMSAGEDLNCNAGYHDDFSYANTLPAAVAQRIPTLTDTFSENDVDTALVRLFTARMKLGEFDDPATVPWVREARARVPQGTWVNSDANQAVTETPQRLALARRAADKSIVLLENRGARLPLRVPRSGPYRVAVMGFFAHPPADQLYLGGYSSVQGPPGQANQVDGYEGIKQAVRAINPNAQVDFYRGFTGSGTTAESLTAVDPAAVDAARNYDAVVVYVGTDAGTATEDRDRTDLALPGAQASLIQQVAARNRNTVAYMETIGPVDVTPFAHSVGALLWSSYNGQRKGDALADVLLGRYNPSARLASIWYRSAAQIPPITDYAIRPGPGNPGRTYMYFRGPLAYPFGYGRSYTRFRFSALRLGPRRLDADGTLRVRFRVANTGGRAGNAVPELYVATPNAPAALQRPIKRLDGFRQVHLAPGQVTTVRMRIRARELAFYEHGRAVLDPGRYVVQIGMSSADRDIALRRSFHVHGRLEPAPTVVTAKPTMPGDAARDVAVRVMFPAGVVVHPKLTVALSDDRLFGYIRKGHSRPFPPGMRFTYASDRPRVVSVDRRGVIRTVSAGVATVTATAILHGHRQSTSFVVHVS